MRLAIETARASKAKGNLPFGCVLVNENAEVIAYGENTIVTEKDCLGHAEVNLIRDVSRLYSFEYLNSCTIYTSDEPCPMCSSAIFWSGIGTLVYGLSKKRYYDIMGRDNPNYRFEMPSREVFEKGGRKVEVIGPLLEDEAAQVHLTQ